MAIEQNYKEEFEKKQKLLEEQKLEKTHITSNHCETIVDGKYCPQFTIFTNDETEYVTISFLSVDNKVLEIRMTKGEYGKFTTHLTMFMNAFLSYSTKKKELIKG